MTPQELAQQAERQYKLKLLSATPTAAEISFVLDCVNDFIDDISEMWQPVGEIIIVVDDINAWNNLPGDFIGVKNITKDGLFYDEVEIESSCPNSQIKFNETGTYKLRYYKHPGRVAALSSEIGLPAWLASLGVMYIAAVKKARDDGYQSPGESPDAQIIFAEYRSKKNARISELKRPERSGHVRLII